MPSARRRRPRAWRRTGVSSSTTATPIEWTDGIRGPQHFEPAQLSDPVVRRADGSWLYMLPSAVDDIEMGVTDVLRGEDHVSNTAVQIQMFTALGRPPPRFAHEALLVGSEGKLSKRLGSLGCDALREAGSSPRRSSRCSRGSALRSRSSRSRTARCWSRRFDLAHFGRAPARFDEAELARLNAAIVHQLPFEHVAARLPDGMGARRLGGDPPNLEKVADAAEWWRRGHRADRAACVRRGRPAYLAEAAPALAWSEDPWGALTAALKEATGRKGKALFHPLRQALTGRDPAPTCTRCCR